MMMLLLLCVGVFLRLHAHAISNFMMLVVWQRVLPLMDARHVDDQMMMMMMMCVCGCRTSNCNCHIMMMMLVFLLLSAVVTIRFGRFDATYSSFTAQIIIIIIVIIMLTHTHTHM